MYAILEKNLFKNRWLRATKTSGWELDTLWWMVLNSKICFLYANAEHIMNQLINWLNLKYMKQYELKISFDLIIKIGFEYLIELLQFSERKVLKM